MMAVHFIFSFCFIFLFVANIVCRLFVFVLVQTLDRFQRGDFQCLVSSDLCARGLNFTNVGQVVNFDCPYNIDVYLHRIGRTGRMGAKGGFWQFGTKQQKTIEQKQTSEQSHFYYLRVYYKIGLLYIVELLINYYTCYNITLFHIISFLVYIFMLVFDVLVYYA